VYPEDLCKESIIRCVFAVGEREAEMTFYDNLTGEVLDWEGVLNARGEEIQEFGKHRLFRKVPSKECTTQEEKHQLE
jgi:hypothetical protein